MANCKFEFRELSTGGGEGRRAPSLDAGFGVDIASFHIQLPLILVSGQLCVFVLSINLSS